MNIVVLVDQDGTILGTMRSVPTSQTDQPSVGFAPEPGQTVQEVELPEEVEDLSPTDLHLAVQKYLADKSGR